MPPAPELLVRTARLDERAAALDLLWSDFSPAERTQRVALLRAEATPSTWDGLFVAERSSRLVGAALGQLQAGRCGSISAPRIWPGEPTGTAVELLAAVNLFLQRAGVRIGQALLRLPLTGDADVLEAGGYRRITDLEYLVAQPPSLPTSLPRSELQFEPCTPDREARLAAIVQQTYQDTLDCPELNGVRAMEDVLAGYRASGHHDPGRWLLVTHEGEPVGCLLLTDYPEQETWELIYMGLKPESRGRGWGAQIARHAQWRTAQAGRPRLVVAVDAANRPAARMYRSVGFELWDRRAVFFLILNPAQS